MTRRSETRHSVDLDVTVHLQPVRDNGTVHVQGSVEVDGRTVTFSGWLDLLDSLERLAERVLEADEEDEEDEEAAVDARPVAGEREGDGA